MTSGRTVPRPSGPLWLNVTLFEAKERHASYCLAEKQNNTTKPKCIL